MTWRMAWEVSLVACFVLRSIKPSTAPGKGVRRRRRYGDSDMLAKRYPGLMYETGTCPPPRCFKHKKHDATFVR